MMAPGKAHNTPTRPNAAHSLTFLQDEDAAAGHGERADSGAEADKELQVLFSLSSSSSSNNNGKTQFWDGGVFLLCLLAYFLLACTQKGSIEGADFAPRERRIMQSDRGQGR